MAPPPHSLGIEQREKRVIEEAYAATLDAERLQEFEYLWESYLDAGLQGNGPSIEPVDLSTVHVHIARALEILERMRHRHIEESRAQTIVDSNYGLGLIVNNRGQIVARNSDAVAVLKDATSLADMGLDENGLTKVLDWINGHKKDETHVLFVNVYFHDATQPTCLFLTRVKLSTSEEKEDLYLLTSVESQIHPGAISAIQNTFSLRSSEADIAFHLANGKSPKEISELRKSSIATVRTQIRHLIEKTHSRDVTDLIRSICNMSARFSSVKSQIERSTSLFSQHNLAKTGSITLRDGRFMEYKEQGHPHGRPVIHIHSLMNGPTQSREDAQHAVLRNWRFISPSRAGYGNSEFHFKTNIRDSVNSTADDMAEIVEHLGLKDVIVIGSIYAQKFALKYPNLVSHFVCVNKAPAWHIDELQSLQPRQRNMIKTSLYAPLLSKFPTRLAKILIDTGREKVFFRGLSGNSKTDLAVLENHRHVKILAEGMKHSFQQGVDAFTLDVQGHHTDWIDDAKNLQVPVTIILGEENSMQTDFGLNRYLTAVPSAKVIRIDNAGLFFPITHFDKILDVLESL